MKDRFSIVFAFVFFSALLTLSGANVPRKLEAAPLVAGTGPTLANPILFVTQVPVPADFTTIGSAFGNQLSDIDAVARGGDLWIRYADGTLKNLTATAGYGNSGFQGATSIAVRDPAVHWGGTKAIFSMVIGAPTQQYFDVTTFWQLYEITGLGLNETPVITKIPKQPANFNNVMPTYGTDDRIIFASDRPRNSQAHLYPQLDEYEEAPTITGLWSLDPVSGDLFMLDHVPSGVFNSTIDSYGRVIFTRWDHLQRDQQADGDALGTSNYGTFNYSDESANATRLNSRAEIFPEPRDVRTDLLAGTGLAGHEFNQFFPWQINEDGTEEETINHVGRHELVGYIPAARTDDPNLDDFYDPSTKFNQNRINNFHQIRESQTNQGNYFGIDAPEFRTHAAGQIISLNAPPTIDADVMAITYVTNRETAEPTDNPTSNHTGLYRNPLPMADGTLVATHTAETRADANTGTRANPGSRYDFRLKTLKLLNGYYVPDQLLTAGISKSISYYDPDVLVSYNGALWEWMAVEVRARTRPARRTPTLQTQEQQAIAQAGVNVAQLQTWMRGRNLALVVSRNITTRDRADIQQPYNLRVQGTNTQTVVTGGKTYDVRFIQFFQADQLRGLTFGGTDPRAGRRVLAQVMHDGNAINPPNPNGPPGSIIIANDGSQAAFVPARRAMTWMMTDANGTGVVRERYWLTFQPGEIRVCTSCHGLNEKDQAGRTTPTNQPQALGQLAAFWKTFVSLSPSIFLPMITR